MDLDKIFEAIFHCEQYSSFIWRSDYYKVLLWVGDYHDDIYSTPRDKHLSLNDYTHITIEVEHYMGGTLNHKAMHDLFGFDLRQYSPSGNYHCGHNVPKQYLIKILAALGIIDAQMPRDWGDGE